MKYIIRTIIALLFVMATVAALGYVFWYLPKFSTSDPPFSMIESREKLYHRTKEKVRLQSIQVKRKISTGQYCRQFCFMIDMGITSGKKRFFVYNLEKDSIEMSGLVTHGSGSDKNGDAHFFSNRSGSNCTSLGSYVVGNSYDGKFGPAYKLHGLDPTNSRAFDRFVVLHAHQCVPNDEVYPFPICVSLGCPTVSVDFLEGLKKYIEIAEKPVILQLYK